MKTAPTIFFSFKTIQDVLCKMKNLTSAAFPLSKTCLLFYQTFIYFCRYSVEFVVRKPYRCGTKMQLVCSFLLCWVVSPVSEWQLFGICARSLVSASVLYTHCRTGGTTHGLRVQSFSAVWCVRTWVLLLYPISF